MLSDGSRLEPDVVVLATGYSQGLEPLIGHLGVLDGKGHPVTRAGATPRGARGLWFNGFTNPISGMLREIAIDSKKVALAMALTKRRRLEELTSAPTGLTGRATGGSAAGAPASVSVRGGTGHRG